MIRLIGHARKFKEDTQDEILMKLRDMFSSVVNFSLFGTRTYIWV